MGDDRRTLAGGKYALLEQVGQGAMGQVYRAQHVALGRPVAIKLLNPAIVGQPNAVDRLRREAKAASLLTHPNSVQVMDFGSSDGTFFVVMEFLDGESLYDRLHQRGHLSETETVHLMVQILGGLAAAHDRGIIHRDMKPENVMLVPRRDDDGQMTEVVKVCDFGIAKLAPVGETVDGPALTEAGAVIGTPAYMAPEQARDLELDRRSDLYSCGVMLYRMVTGRIPFDAETPVGVLMKHVLDPPEPPRAVNPAISQGLEQIILRAMAKAPEDRFQTARDMRRALLELTAAEGAPAATPTAGTPAVPRAPTGPTWQTGAVPTPRSGARRWLAVAVIACLVLGAVAVSLLLTDRAEPQDRDGVEDGGEPSRPTPPPRVAEPEPSPVLNTASAPLPRADLPPAGVTLPAVALPSAALARRAEAGEAVRSPRQTLADAPPRAPAVHPASRREPPSRPVARRPAPSPGPRAARPESGPVAAAPVQPAEPKPAEPKPAEPKPVEAKPVEAKPVEARPVAAPEAVAAPESAAKPAPKATPALDAKVSTGSFEIMGAIPLSAIRRAVSRERGALRACYKAAAGRAGTDHAGSATIGLTIDEDGLARWVSVSDAPLPGLADCLKSAAGRVRSRVRPDTGTVKVTFKVTFKPLEPTR